MKRIIIFSILVSLLQVLHAQRYEMSFQLPGATDSILYLGQHYRDQFITLDSAVVGKENTYRFAGKHKFETGMYALYPKEAKKALLEFTIDGSQRFSIRTNSDFEVLNPKTDISGSAANQAMHTYINRFNQARKRSKELEQLKKSSDPQLKENAEKEMESLNEEMIVFENGKL